MESRWSKAKKALGVRLKMGICIAQPLTAEDAVESASSSAAVAPPAPAPAPATCRSAPASPHLPSPLRLVRSATRSSRRMCAICLETMRAGHGHALFTAECSHTFHFHCIASNVKHGNRVCPVCRAKWSEVPLQGPPIRGRTRINPVAESADAWPWPFLFPAATLTHRLPPPRPPLPTEPATFEDDEPVAPPPAPAPNRSKHLQLDIVPDFPAVPRAEARDDFTVLVHVKAPSGAEGGAGRERAPIDLVTVLDVSGSMAGTKLALLKRAMSFVIHNLGPADRLSVVAFSSSARRLFPLCRMSEAGRQVALQAVNGLASSGGTNIAHGLRKATQVLQQRRHRNPVCSVILLSDGQDTYSVTSRRVTDYQSLLPANARSDDSEPASARAPIHTFGFGADHDSGSMHSISEASGGTFSFIETEGMIQDAFAQCIGGLLSVVVQDMRVTLASASASPPVPVSSVQAGSYSATVAENGHTGVVHIGDLYAEEERDFLVHVRLPAVGDEKNDDETPVLEAATSYRDPVSRQEIRTSLITLSVRRPDSSATGDAGSGSLEVDRQRNRLCTAESIAEARALADRGDLTAAQAVLGDRRRALQASLAARLGDQLCASLDAELKQIQERMATRQLYETSGRAYALSGLSSHSWQRVTTRGDNTDSSTSLVYGYQTPSMIDMLMRSQTISLSVNNNNNNNNSNNNSARTRTLLPSRSMPLTEYRSSSH